ncbi:MAG: hypothetical protein APR63_01440 [Desulfuromonas sp. SDB]|nr:MAG: hypothetical protein APR63_01440 [Desulfuromonas sp. SDB]
MAHAYTPGLKVTARTVLRKERRLPLKGKVMVSEIGTKVKAEQIVARTELPGNVLPLNLAGKLGCDARDVKGNLKVKIGDKIAKHQLIAETKGLLGLFKSSVRSPLDGSLESVSDITGQAILREPPQPVETDAYIEGKVVEIIPDEGVIIETVCTFIQGIFGIGGEIRGEIYPVVEQPDQELTVELLNEDCRDKIVIGGSFCTAPVLEKAVQVGARAVVVGGIDDEDLKNFLGYDVGVAITGNEQMGITLVVTEGFGKIPMANKTFRLLQEKKGYYASVNGATQIRAGVMRPEVIITLEEDQSMKTTGSAESGMMEVGTPVRIIREPYFGELGKVAELPPHPMKIETEAKTRVVKVKLDDGKEVLLPRANVELIEE